MQAFFIQLNVCCSFYYRLLQVWYHFQPTDLDLFKSHTKPGKRKKIKLFFTQQHQLSIFSRQGRDKYMCPEAQDLESCPQMHETITASQKKKVEIFMDLNVQQQLYKVVFLLELKKSKTIDMKLFQCISTTSNLENPSTASELQNPLQSIHCHSPFLKHCQM